jgi:DNA-directed RNA polymerase specialized sigma24 family protein
VEEIYREQRAFMFGVAYGRLRNRDSAEDAVQDAALILMRQRLLSGDGRAVAYTAVDYATRAIVDRERYRMHSRLDVEEVDGIHCVPSAERVAMARIDLEGVARACPPAVMAGMGYRVGEIAAAMGVSASALYSRIERWRAECWDGVGGSWGVGSS